MAKLVSETCTETVRRKVVRAAMHRLGRGKYQANFEHGQWSVTRINDGAQWSVMDCQKDGVDYLDFEQVTQGDEEEG